MPDEPTLRRLAPDHGDGFVRSSFLGGRYQHFDSTSAKADGCL
jgi:hypothetical protein